MSLVLACTQKKNSASSESSTDDFYVTISTKYDTGSDYEDHAVCSLTGTADDPKTEDCDVSIPEAQLFYSSLKFSFKKTATGACSIVSFTPYSFLASVSAGYIPPGTTTAVDCSVSPTPLTCYHGPAKGIVTDYPDYTAMYSSEEEQEYTVTSSNSQQFGSNRWTVNNMTIADQAVTVAPGAANGAGRTITEGYIANSYADYKVECIDDFDNILATININISDDDGSSPPTDSIRTWQ